MANSGVHEVLGDEPQSTAASDAVARLNDAPCEELTHEALTQLLVKNTGPAAKSVLDEGPIMVPALAGAVPTAVQPAAHINTLSPTSIKELKTGISEHSCTQDNMSETDGEDSADEDGAAEQCKLSDTDGGESSDDEDVAKYDGDLAASAIGTTNASEVVGTVGDTGTNMDIDCEDGTSAATTSFKKNPSDTVRPDDHDTTKKIRPRNIAAAVAAFAGSLAKPYLTLDQKKHVAAMVGVSVAQVNNCMNNYRKRFKKQSREEDKKPSYASYTSVKHGGGGNASGLVSPD